MGALKPPDMRMKVDWLKIRSATGAVHSFTTYGVGRGMCGIYLVADFPAGDPPPVIESRADTLYRTI